MLVRPTRKNAPAIAFKGYHPVSLFEKNRHRGKRGVEQGHAPLADKTGTGQDNKYHYRNATLATPTRMHHQRQGHDIGRYLQRELQSKGTADADNSQPEQAGSGKIGNAYPVEKPGVLFANVQRAPPQRYDPQKESRNQ